MPSSTAAPLVPASVSLRKIAEAAKACTACHLYEEATQTVFGAGTKKARLVVVGEQPGDVEDRKGRPFVGPAGRILDEAFEAAAIGSDDVYLTNAVKHFKWKPAPRGKRRLHVKPNAAEIGACHPWLEKELALVDPAVVVVLGASAAKAVVGRRVRVHAERGTPLSFDGRQAIVTLHPSAVLRGRERRHELQAMLIDDLCVAAELAGLR